MLNLRPPRPSDLHALHAYINTLSQEHTFIRFQGEEVTLSEEQEYLTNLLKKINEHKTAHLLAFLDDQLIGVASVELQANIESHIGLLGITIANEHRGKGYGKTLLTEILAAAQAQLPGLRIITLGVFANNPAAVHLYATFGFTEYAKLPDGIKHNGVFVDHVYMYKRIA